MRLYFAGGLNEQQTPNIYECGEGYNFELGMKQSKLVPRKPYALKGTATNASAINGFVQLVKRDSTETTLVQAGDTVYLWDGDSSFTSKGTVSTSSRLRDTYWSLGDYSIITDTAKATVVKKWDGTTFSTMTTGLGTNLYAKYGIVHQGRVWLANVTTSTDTPHLMVASKFEDPTVYDTAQRAVTGTFSTGAEAFYMLSPDLKPINGFAVFYNQLVMSTEGGRLYVLTGTGTSSYKWTDYYAGSCASGTESICNIGNDVVYMKAGGGIDLLKSTVNSGDVETDDLSRWILTTTADAVATSVVYDQKNQKVFFFISGKVLVLFKDLIGSEMSPWSVYKTQETFAFATNGAKYMKQPGTQVYTVYFGDSVGRIFDMNGDAGGGDAGSQSIAVLRRTRYIANGEGGDQKGGGALSALTHNVSGLVSYRRIATSCDLSVTFDWGDEYNRSTSVIPLKGSPTASAGVYFGSGSYFSGTAYFSQGSAYARKISSQSFSPTGKGPGCFIEASLDTSTDFQIDYIDVQ